MLAFPAFPSAAAEPSPPAIVRKVSIQGNKLIETETIASRLRTVVGSVFDPEVISEDVRGIYGMDYFSSVQVSALPFEGGLEIVFQLKEKPIVVSVEFRGNKKVKTDELRKLMEIKSNAVVDEYAIRIGVERLLALYREKGYYNAAVDHRLETVSEGEISLVFVIKEGEPLWVRDILVRGNDNFSARTIRGLLKTKKKGLLSYFTKSGTLQSYQLEEDAMRIVSFYNNQGYLKAKVDPPTAEIDQEKKAISVTFVIHEGIRYEVGELSVPGDEHFTTEKITEVMKTRSGEVFKRDVFARDITAVTGLYTDIGYAFCRVDPGVFLDDEKKLINIRLIITPGPLVHVGRIKITGNQTTRDNVIRREVDLKEGEVFSSKALARSRQKVMNLGFFEKVDITTEPRGNDVVDVNIDVGERLTGSLSLGIGYSSQDKFGGTVKLTQENLFGKGYKAQASVEYGETRREYNIYFYNPAVWDSAYSAGFRLYDTTLSYTDYDKHATGGSISIGRSLGEYVRGLITFKNESVDVTDISADASPVIKDQAGRRLSRSTALTLSRDTRDNFFQPTTGSRFQITTEYSGGFQGGDTDFVKNVADAAFYFPLWWKFVFAVHGQAGFVSGFDGSEVPIYERFFLGGLNSVRGFPSRSLGPRDREGEVIGGHKEAFIQNEIIFPIVESQKLNGVIFFDAGQAFRKHADIDVGEFRCGAGAGVRWFSPIGPFRIEWGLNLFPKEGEERSDWQFSIGTAF